MTFEEALQKGYLNLDEDEARTVIEEVDGIEDSETRLTNAVALLQTFVEDDKIDMVLNLCAVILNAEAELDEVEDDEEGELEEEDKA